MSCYGRGLRGEGSGKLIEEFSDFRNGRREREDDDPVVGVDLGIAYGDERPAAAPAAPPAVAAGEVVAAPMPGNILTVNCSQGQAVKAGDIIEVTFGNRPIKVRVLSDVEPRTKDVAREMYEVIAE